MADKAAAAGAGYRAVLRVGHGCAGAATTAITVTIPSGFTSAQPLVKPGWVVSTKIGKLEQSYEAHGKTYIEGVQEITWTAKGAENALPDAFADEFVFRGTTPKKPGTLWFKVVQACDKGSNAWVEIPAAGKDAHQLKSPAARLDVLDVQAGGGHAH
ncbi:MAG: YcnI family protein [Rhodoferax sp.]|uniref:YcnI family protein n=1 Tax=Rhodoferax sp. TaxID=50421 RepID=UPI002ACE8902|nr:YcnI family protein [Rhodoferax sp.]MDZ7890291.1 YcnI family protein [Rhodoferax sp.]